MMKQILLLFCFASGLIVSVSESKSASVQPHAMKTASNCSYLVVISTSCASPKFTTDKIGIAFGDAYGNEVYEAGLDDPVSRTFEQCSSDTFQIDGACASPICYVYLYRAGAEDGWKPESVKIFGYNSPPVTFNFDTPIPNGTWYGHNLCETRPSSSYQLLPQKWLISLVLGFVLSIWV